MSKAGEDAVAIAHGSTRGVAYPSMGPDGIPTSLTGLLHLPLGQTPPGGWPFATYGHMTTGGNFGSAPSLGSPTHPEYRRMTQGDALCSALLARGIAILRPDYPGLGNPGVHPYLIGDPLGRSVIDMVRARHNIDASLGNLWVSAGHSEGATAALFSARATMPDPPDAELRAVAAFSPVTRMDRTIGMALRLPVMPPGWGVLSALIGLMLRGAETTSAEIAELIHAGGLSPRAEAAWPHLAERSAAELSRPDSWGGIAPARLGGPRGAELFSALQGVLKQNEVGALSLRPVPIRIDAGLFDEVAPAPLTAALMKAYRAQGVALTTRWWPSHHSGIMRENYAPSAAADWIAEQLA